MRNFIIFLVSCFVFFIYPSIKVSAQTPPIPIQESQSWKCLKGDEKTFTFETASSTTFSQDLMADGYLLDQDAYIVTCVGTEQGGVCTTGDANHDLKLFNNDNTKLFPYQVTIEGCSKKKIYQGKLQAKATVSTVGLAGGMAFYSVVLGDLEDTVGSGPGQKQGIFPFTDSSFTKCVTIAWTTLPSPTPTPLPQQPPPPPGDGEGRRRRWDPFGIVFDSQSLEPMANIKVTIFDKNKNFYRLLGLTNPQTNRADGLFNFLVEPGIYYLTTSLPSGYSFTASPNLHPNYIKIYHKADGSNSIYKPDEPIVEEIDTPEEVRNGRPNIEHRDIPLDPGTNTPYVSEPKTIVYKFVKLGGVTTFDGRVSHPFSIVTLNQGETKLAEVRSDRFGFYEVEVSNSKIKQNMDIVITYTKADLKTIDLIEMTWKKNINKILSYFLSIFAPTANAQTKIKILAPSSTLTVSPILSYVEGYAYDGNGKVLPKATVRLRLNMNKAVYYSTTADKNGYFLIPPKHTPIFPYYF